MSTLFSETTHESRGAGVLSVSDLTSRLRDLVEDRVGDVRVEGELVDFTRAASGHCYFKLQDDDAKISCVMWCWQAERLAFTPEDGMLLHAEGEVSLYEKRGDLQIKVEALEVAGEGALQKAFERLRRKLSGEGLFDEVGQGRLRISLPREEHGSDGVGVGERSVEHTLEELAGGPQEDAGPVAGRLLRARGSAVFEVLEQFETVRDRLVGDVAVEVHDDPYPTVATVVVRVREPGLARGRICSLRHYHSFISAPIRGFPSKTNGGFTPYKEI